MIDVAGLFGRSMDIAADATWHIRGVMGRLFSQKTVVWLSCICVGLAAPASVFGKGAVGVFFGLAALGALTVCARDKAWGPVSSLLRSVPAVLIAATFTWWLIVSIQSIDLLESLSVWARMIAFLAGAAIISGFLFGQNERVSLAIKALAVGALLFFGYAAIATYIPTWTRPLELVRATQVDPVAYFKASASVIAICIPVLIWAGLKYRGIWLMTAWASILPGAVVIFGDGREPSRAAIAGLIAAGLLPLLVYGLSWLGIGWRRVVSSLIVIAGLASAAWMISALPSPTADGQFEAETALPWPDQHRQVIWGFVRDRALERPLFGYGINTINAVPGAKREIEGLRQEFVPSHPHNWVMEVLAETGFPGLLLFLGIILAIVVELAKSQDLGRKGTSVTLAVIAAFFVSSLANFSFWSAWWQVSFLAVLAIVGSNALRESHIASAGSWRDAKRGPIAPIATGVTLVVIASLLLGLWSVRRTDAGRVIYKRTTAPSEFVYEKIPPVFLRTDPDSLIEMADDASTTAIRKDLVNAIWGVDTIPNRLNEVTVSDVTDAPLYRMEIWWPAGIERIERIVIPFEHGYNSIGYVLVPKEKTGRGMVYAHGYAGDITQAVKEARTLLYDGYTVALLNFPGYGENGLSEFDHPRFGFMARDHDLLLAIMDNPLRYYIDPVVVMADYLRSEHGADHVDAMGFSAGGWAVTLAAASDPRFRTTVSVAGVLPLYLRLGDRRNQWPPPHLYPPLLSASNYLEMFVLAGLGSGRGYYQIFNRYDRCCYRNALGTLYEQAVAKRIQALGEGAFAVAIDETHADHKVSLWARRQTLEWLNMPREDEAIDGTAE